MALFYFTLILVIELGVITNTACIAVGQTSDSCNSDQLLTGFIEAMQLTTRSKSGLSTPLEPSFPQRLSVVLEMRQTRM